MESIHCTDCGQTFCSKYNLLRHKRNKHMQEKLPGKPPGAPQGAPGAHFGAPGAPQGPLQGAPQRAPGKPESQGVSSTMRRTQDMMLYHPFTMMISGPTCKLILSLLN